MNLTVFAAENGGPHVSLPAEELFTLFGLPVTNAMFTGIFGYALVIWLMVYVSGKVKNGHKNRFVSLFQWIYEGLYKTVYEVTGDKLVTKRLAPLAITLFFFILINYWIGVLPIVNTLTVGEVPVLRSLAADLNTTFALAIVTVVMAQVYAIQKHGFAGNLGRYFRNPLKDVAGAFEGILELIAEFSRLMGLSLRLFGNVFAGEVLLVMIAFLTVYATPIALPPFLAFELFIGAIQAYIFFMLTVVFISLGLAGHGDHGTDSERTLDHPIPDTTARLPESEAMGAGK